MHAQPGTGLHDDDETDQAELQAVLSRIADQDEQALGRFYDLTLSRIYGLILRVVRNPADAEEVVGDVYLQVWEKACDFRSERGCVLAWLKTLAWSRAVDRQRRGRKYAMEVELHPEGLEPAYTECEGQNAEAAPRPGRVAHGAGWQEQRRCLSATTPCCWPPWRAWCRTLSRAPTHAAGCAPR